MLSNELKEELAEHVQNACMSVARKKLNKELREVELNCLTKIKESPPEDFKESQRNHTIYCLQMCMWEIGFNGVAKILKEFLEAK